MIGSELRPVVKNSIKSAFALLGLEVESKNNRRAALPPVYDTLEKAIYAKNIGLAVSYDCPLEKCVSANGFSFSEEGFHPFVAALRDIGSRSNPSSYADSLLERYYQAWAPKNGRTVYPGFEDAPDGLEAVPAITIHSPWMEASPEHRQVLMERTIAFENAAADEPDLPPSAGYGLHGPVTPTKGQLEYRRLLKVFNSVKDKGFDRAVSREDITAIAIERNGDYRFCIMHGQHRMAALAVLDYKQAPINLTKLLHFDEIEHWPQVYRGVWGLSQARAYIDHLFDFDSLEWARKQQLLDAQKNGMSCTTSQLPTAAGGYEQV